MAETKYEVTYIIRPDLDEAAKTELVERFDNILKENGASIIDSKDWQSVSSHMRSTSTTKVSIIS